MLENYNSCLLAAMISNVRHIGTVQLLRIVLVFIANTSGNRVE